MFNIDFQDIIKKLLPAALRLSNVKDVLFALIKPLKSLNTTFKSWKDGIDYDLQFNGQTMYLQRVLNDQFDSVLRRIYIEDTSVINNIYVANKVEGSVTLYLANKSETSAPVVYLENLSEQVNQIHFKVRVPSALTFSTIVMTALVDKYKIAEKNYTIQTF